MLGQPSPPSAVAPHGRSRGNSADRARGSSADLAWPSSASSQQPVASAWPPTVQQNLGKPAEGGKAALTRQQEIANAPASSFFAPTAPRAQRASQDIPAKSHWTAGKPSLHPQQVQAQASANLLRYQQSNAAEAFQNPHAQFNYPQSHVQQLASSLQRPHQMGFPHTSGQNHYSGQSLSRVSCDYPQAVSRQRASVDFASGQQSGHAQLHTANSLDIALSRQSLAAAREFAALDEATKQQAPAAAVRGGNFPPWQSQSSSMHPVAAWPAQPQLQQHSLSPQALQLHALNMLNAVTGVPQESSAQHSQWGSSQNCLHSISSRSEFGRGTFQFPPIQQSSPHKPSLQSSVDLNSLSFGSSVHLSRQPPSELAAKTSEVQGAWGSHLDAGDSPSSRRASSASRQNQQNPFLQPDSAFSIREAKQLLHHPKPIPKGVIPRVDTFASTLHDAWGAHAEHNTPPGADENLDSRPPRLSSESVRSNASHRSQASSSKLSTFVCCFCIYTKCMEFRIHRHQATSVA